MGNVAVFAHPEEGVQRSWLVQGLPWPECRHFAHQLVAHYQAWHNRQCEQLSLYFPRWQQELSRLKRLPSFLSHSSVEAWVAQVYADLKLMDMTLHEAQKHLPTVFDTLLPWLLDTSATLYERNKAWLEIDARTGQSCFPSVNRRRSMSRSNTLCC